MDAERPTPLSYWVEPGQLMAGEYPGAKDKDVMQRKLERFVALGFTHFVDLTETVEGLRPYAPTLAEIAHAHGKTVIHQRLAIPDMGVPGVTHMRLILDRIDEAIAGKGCVYIHCFGGHGRTGMVVGCWMVRHGYTPDQALVRITALRAALPSDLLNQPSPQTTAQIEFVKNWGK